MPLRDHFHAPLRERHHWEGFHSAWTNTLVRHLNIRWLPPRYRAEPQVHLGAQVEVDVATFQEEVTTRVTTGAGNGVATAVWAPPRPAQSFAVSLPAQDLFEVRVYDEQRGSRLVAAIELVSPANKDRPEHRHAFAIKCAAYLQQNVSVAIVDMVTERRDNLHAELLRLLRLTETPPWPEGADLYATAYHTTQEDGAWRLDVWREVLALGAGLPTLPVWLAADLAVPVELEPSYEETYQVLRLP